MMNDLWTETTNPLFIVGAPRSGTTWLQAMLASHDDVATGQETHFFKAFSGADKNYRTALARPVGLRQYWTEDRFYSECSALYHRLTSLLPAPPHPVKFFLEKTPEHVLYWDFILRCFPKARFVHIVRDPRHVVASLIRTSGIVVNSGMNATLGARVWRNAVDAALELKEAVSSPDQFIEVRYEALRKNPEPLMRQLFAELGLDISDDELKLLVAQNELGKTSRSGEFTVFESARVGSDMSEPDGFFGKGSIDANEFNLTRLQQYRVEHLAGNALQRYDYEPISAGTPFWARLASSWVIRKWLRVPQV